MSLVVLGLSRSVCIPFPAEVANCSLISITNAGGIGDRRSRKLQVTFGVIFSGDQKPSKRGVHVPVLWRFLRLELVFPFCIVRILLFVLGSRP